MAIKQHPPKQPMSQGRNHRETKYFETNENKNTMYHNLWDITKGVLRRKFMFVNTFFF